MRYDVIDKEGRRIGSFDPVRNGHWARMFVVQHVGCDDTINSRAGDYACRPTQPAS